jgi:hypothetical protein
VAAREAVRDDYVDHALARRLRRVQTPQTWLSGPPSLLALKLANNTEPLRGIDRTMLVTLCDHDGLVTWEDFEVTETEKMSGRWEEASNTTAMVSLLRTLAARVSARRHRLAAAGLALHAVARHFGLTVRFDGYGLQTTRKEAGCAGTGLAIDTWLRSVRTAVEHADGLATDAELEEAELQCRNVALSLLPHVSAQDGHCRLPGKPDTPCGWYAADAGQQACVVREWTATVLCSTGLVDGTWKEGCELLRCVYGNPWSGRTYLEQRCVARGHKQSCPHCKGTGFLVPTLWEPARLLKDGMAFKMATRLYEEGPDAADLAVLADQLEDVGCTDALVLAHLRTPGVHGRGCWVLDGILGRRL